MKQVLVKKMRKEVKKKKTVFRNIETVKHSLNLQVNKRTANKNNEQKTKEHILPRKKNQ